MRFARCASRSWQIHETVRAVVIQQMQSNYTPPANHFSQENITKFLHHTILLAMHRTISFTQELENFNNNVVLLMHFPVCWTYFRHCMQVHAIITSKNVPFLQFFYKSTKFNLSHSYKFKQAWLNNLINTLLPKLNYFEELCALASLQDFVASPFLKNSLPRYHVFILSIWTCKQFLYVALCVVVAASF